MSEPGPHDARSHYNAFPYDVGLSGGDVYLSAAGPLRDFAERIDGGALVDIGCGPGNLLAVLGRRADYTIGIDISEVSVSLAQRLVQETDTRASVIQGDALALPLAARSVDVAVAAGSLHHTGDARQGFAELSRVLRPGGRAYVVLYRSRSYYELLYRSMGRVARAAQRRRLTSIVVNQGLLLVVFAIYFIAGRAIVQRRLHVPSRRELWNYFADQMLHPVVSFQSEDDIREWAIEFGIEMTHLRATHAGALLNATLSKPAVTHSGQHT